MILANTAKCVAKTLLKNLQPPTQHIESNEEEELCVKHFLLDHLKEVDEKYDDSALSLVHKRMLSEKKFNAFLNSLCTDEVIGNIHENLELLEAENERA